RCLAVDLPLHGRTPPRPDHDYSLRTLAASLRDFLVAIDVPAVHLVGNDTGGAVCQVFAAEWPERLRSLTLTNCDTRGNIPPEPFLRIVDMARQGRLARIATRWVNDLNLARSERNIGAGYRDTSNLSDEAIRHYLGPVMGNEEVAREFEHFLATALREEDLVAAESKLARLDVPTLLVWAADDIFFDVEWARWLSRLIPGAGDPVVIKNAALYFPDERPEELIPHLRRHWLMAERAASNTGTSTRL
ncbi:MAG TPA: alpha/beta hydrolase, partial [Dehalococcoidia bacterium]|nr:alpha/beta hydrolase [Dehalococcoidia bacterium]